MCDFTGTKESIKGAKTWFMQRSAYGPAIVEVLKDRVLSMDEVDRQLPIIYLANDILFNRLGILFTVLSVYWTHATSTTFYMSTSGS